MNEPKPTPTIPIKQQRMAEAIKAANNLAGAILQQASNRLIGGIQDNALETDMQIAAMCISFVKQLQNSYCGPQPLVGTHAPPIKR